MVHLITRRLMGGAVLGATALARAATAQERYPTRAVTVIVPYAPGGSTDFTARLLAQGLSGELGQQFVIDNRAGAVGTIGTNAVARARPDGYTLLVMPNTNYAMVPHMMRLPYETNMLTPVSLLATNGQFLCVSPQTRANTLGEFVALAKAQPGRLTYSSSGAGSSAHLAAELFIAQAGLDLTHVPYRGGAPAAQALLTNEVQMSMVDAVTALPFIQANQVRALAFTGAERSRQAPTVPTVGEGGLQGFTSSTDFALFAPAGTPTEVLNRLAEASKKVMTSSEARGRMEPLAIEPVGSTPQEFVAYNERENAKWRGVITSRNIRLD
ncbi:Bug family tripartite tricarboxylate transporter substrate binding protein [Roseomonas sp. CCTCC AB2023176]|uniref:Bug family tripartite tricarboxylate transporter substrate binding protein n=1 Tax=Roseomonas sp. CCTCC AB2023176 TaxID=3342640 RepID=UPI0035D7B779